MYGLKHSGFEMIRYGSRRIQVEGGKKDVQLEFVKKLCLYLNSGSRRQVPAPATRKDTHDAKANVEEHERVSN